MANMTWIAGYIIAAIVVIFQAFMMGKKSGKDEQKSKDADSYEKHLSDISNANSARSSVTDSLPDKDKYRRD